MQSSVLNALTVASDLIGGYYCLCLSHQESEVRTLGVGTFTQGKGLGSSVRALKCPSLQEKPHKTSSLSQKIKFPSNDKFLF